MDRFWRWTTLELNSKLRQETIEYIHQTVEDYEYALKKHGILTTLGGLTTIMSSASSIFHLFQQSSLEKIAGGIVISSAIISYTADQAAKYIDNKRNPIAYYHDVLKLR